MLNIIKVSQGSIAKELGIQPEDKILKVNDQPVNDQIDFKFHSAEEKIELLLQRGAEQFHYEIEKEYHSNAAVYYLEQMEMAL